MTFLSQDETDDALKMYFDPIPLHKHPQEQVGTSCGQLPSEDLFQFFSSSIFEDFLF